MKLSKQEIKLFLDLKSKNFFEKIFIFPNLHKFFKQELNLLILFLDPFHHWEPKEVHLDNAWLV